MMKVTFWKNVKIEYIINHCKNIVCYLSLKICYASCAELLLMIHTSNLKFCKRYEIDFEQILSVYNIIGAK